MNQKYTPSDQTLKVILSNYNIVNFTYKQSLDGIENTTIFVFAKNRNYVLRVYRLGSKTDIEIEIEIEFMSFLDENDFPVPEIYPNKSNDLLTKVIIDKQEWQVVLMEKIHGIQLPQNEWIRDEDLLQNMAETQAELHLLGSEFSQILLKNDYDLEVYASGVGKTLMDKYNQIKEIDDLDQNLVEIISDIKSLSYEYNPFLPLAYIHDDFYWDNLIIDDDETINVIDFGDLRVGPIVSCLASGVFTVILSAFELGENIQIYAQKYVDFYKNIRDLETAELTEVIKPIELTIDLYIVSEILKQKNMNQKIENYLKLKDLIKNLIFV